MCKCNIFKKQLGILFAMVGFLYIFSSSATFHRDKQIMDKIQKLELMDKIQRELKDLEQSQTAVLKKVSQIAAHNINLSAELLDQKLPDLQESIDANVMAISGISEAFEEYRNKFFNDNNMGAKLDPTA